MRVCIVTESFLPHVNGVTNSVLRVLEHLRATGHEAMVIAPQGSVDEYQGFPVAHQAALHLKKWGDIKVGFPSPRLTPTIRDFAPDVVHLASPLVLGHFGAKAAAALDVPVVAVFQTDVAAFARAYGFGDLTYDTLWRHLARLHRGAARTLVPSTATQDDCVARGIPNVHIWQRGIDAVRFGPARRSDALRSQWGADGRTVVGFVGRLAPEKRVGDLAALVGRTDVQLVVVGDGPARSELERALPSAIFTGLLGGADLPEAVASLDVFVHTGPNETFCQAVQEGLASGVPVVAVNQGGPRDLVNHGVTGYLIDTSDADELNMAIDKLTDPHRRRDFGAAARASVIGRSWQAIGDELLDHYRCVIESQDAMAVA